MLLYRNVPLSTYRAYRDIPPIYPQRLAVKTTDQTMHIHCTYVYIYTCTYTVHEYHVLYAYTTTVDGLLCFCCNWPGIKKFTIFWTGPSSILSHATEGLGMSLSPASASLCLPWKPVQTTGYTMHIHCMYMYIHCIYMYIQCTRAPHIFACTTKVFSSAN